MFRRVCLAPFPRSHTVILGLFGWLPRFTTLKIWQARVTKIWSKIFVINFSKTNLKGQQILITNQMKTKNLTYSSFSNQILIKAMRLSIPVRSTSQQRASPNLDFFARQKEILSPTTHYCSSQSICTWKKGPHAQKIRVNSERSRTVKSSEFAT